jgi:hypothetical protein
MDSILLLRRYVCPHVSICLLVSTFYQPTVCLSACLYGEAFTPALKREHPALQNMKFLNFFLCLWVIVAIRDPD